MVVAAAEIGKKKEKQKKEKDRKERKKRGEKEKSASKMLLKRATWI